LGSNRIKPPGEKSRFDPFSPLIGDLSGIGIINGIGVVLGDENYFPGNGAVLQSPLLSVGQLVGGTNYGLAGSGGNYSGYSYYQLDGQVVSVSAGVVPIPAAVWLFGSALGLLGWMRRKST
jgi:hypothetical protein